MKIAVSATGSNIEADVDPRFGRCQYFAIIDSLTMEFEPVEKSSVMVSGRSEIAAAQMIAGTGVKVVLTGNCGPNAYQMLSGAGIQVITGVSGKIKDALERYKSGELEASSQPNVSDHFLPRVVPSFGFSMGMGRGMGRGMRMEGSIISSTKIKASPQSLEQELE